MRLNSSLSLSLANSSPSAVLLYFSSPPPLPLQLVISSPHLAPFATAVLRLCRTVPHDIRGGRGSRVQGVCVCGKGGWGCGGGGITPHLGQVSVCRLILHEPISRTYFFPRTLLHATRARHSSTWGEGRGEKWVKCKHANAHAHAQLWGHSLFFLFFLSFLFLVVFFFPNADK